MWRGEKGWREHQCLDRDEVAAQSMTIVIGHLGVVQLMGVFGFVSVNRALKFPGIRLHYRKKAFRQKKKPLPQCCRSFREHVRYLFV